MADKLLISLTIIAIAVPCITKVLIDNLTKHLEEHKNRKEAMIFDYSVLLDKSICIPSDLNRKLNCNFLEKNYHRIENRF